MPRSWWAKFLALIGVTVCAAAYVTPTALNLDPEKSTFFVKQKINLGLDLQGGVHLVLGVDFRKVYADVAGRLLENLNDDIKKKNIACSPGKLALDGKVFSEDPRIIVECSTPVAKSALRDFALQDSKDSYDTLRIVEDNPKNIQFGLSKLYQNEIREKTIRQSIEVIRNRIDEFGVSEPVITSQGSDRLSVELPGIKDIERAKELIGRTAKLEFKLVDLERKSSDEIEALVSELEAKNSSAFKEKQKFSDYVRKINELARDKIPSDTEIVFERKGKTEERIAYLVKRRPEVTGEDLKDAVVQIDPQDNRPQVSLVFSPRGAEKFERVTGENLGSALAIVLDGIVHSAPIIQSKVSQGRAHITLGQGDYNSLLKNAHDLSIILRAGALPAQLDFLEQRAVGPSLGQDSIQKGKWASIIGCLAIFLFMLFYYRGSGLIADVSLVLNVLFVLAILIGLDATLTLPGIAGIALTVGIAVDSNVVIYERIREELRAGKSPKVAVEAGFHKAFRTILDANVTNAVAAIVLMNFGTGPVRGFAVSLLIGILTTLFTAVFVSKLLFDWYLERKDMRELSI